MKQVFITLLGVSLGTLVAQAIIQSQWAFAIVGVFAIVGFIGVIVCR